MSKDNSSYQSQTDDFKEVGSGLAKSNLNKYEYDLYHEEDDIALPVVRVKRIGNTNKGEKWKIFSDNKVYLIIDGHKLNNKEKDFLRTIDGVNFLISQYKLGVRSFNALKNEIKKKISGLDK